MRAKEPPFDAVPPSVTGLAPEVVEDIDDVVEPATGAGPDSKAARH